MIKFIRTYKNRTGNFPELEEERNQYVLKLFKGLEEEVKSEETLEGNKEVIEEPIVVAKPKKKEEKKEIKTKKKDLKKFKKKKRKIKTKREKKEKPKVNRKKLAKKRCYALNIADEDYDGYFDPIRPTDQGKIKRAKSVSLSSNWKLVLTILALSATAAVSFIIPFLN